MEHIRRRCFRFPKPRKSTAQHHPCRFKEICIVLCYERKIVFSLNRLKFWQNVSGCKQRDFPTFWIMYFQSMWNNKMHLQMTAEEDWKYIIKIIWNCIHTVNHHPSVKAKLIMPQFRLWPRVARSYLAAIRGVRTLHWKLFSCTQNVQCYDITRSYIVALPMML